MANIFDIAKEAGVSRSTVSRVINNYPGVKDEKRQRVLDAIEKLNYIPNAAARVLALNKTHTIGVIVKELGDSFFAEFLRNIYYISDRYGYGAIYCNRNNFMTTEVNYLQRLNKQVDGYIFLGEFTVSKEELEKLVHSEEIVLTVGFDLKVEGVSAFTIDNYQATYDAIKRLIEKGHEKILYISYEDKTIEFTDRIKAYEQALKDHGLPFHQVNKVDYTDDAAYHLGIQLSQFLKEENITAIMCGNDTIAIEIMDACIESGLRIPEDVSVIGFDNIFLHRMTNNYLPSLTTIAQPQKEISEYIVEHFVGRVDRDEQVEIKEFKCTYIERDSTK